MVLTLEQRLDSLEVRLNELHCWNDRAYVDLHGWTFDGRPWDIGEQWPSREGLATIAHGEVAVPGDWPLDGTWLDLNLGGEGLLRIRYGDGEEPWGLDAFHRRFPLRERSFSIETSAVARMPFGVPNRDARLEWARLVLLDGALLRLTRQIRLVIDTGRAFGGHEVVEHLVRSAERALALLDWPSDTQAYLSRSRNTPRMLHIWELPPNLDSHPAGLTPEQEEMVAAASMQLEGDLIALCDCFPQHGTLAITGHAHLDLAWLWPMEETRRKGLRTSSTALGLMERYPELTFIMTTAQLYAFMEQDDPALFARIKEKVAAGQWEPLGGMWVEPDLNMPTGESLVRQALYGQRYFQQRFGSTHTVAWLPDCFGFTPALPQILRGAGLENFFTIKVNWSETNRFPYDLFWWEGLDGSRVLAHTFDNPIQSPWASEEGSGGYNAKPDPLSMKTTWENYRGKYAFPESLLSIGYGDGGGGPSVEMLEAARELASFPALPALRFTSVRDYYERAREAIKDRELPVWVGELYLELHRGTLTTQGCTKYLHRRAERDLIAAEVLGGMNALAGETLPASLEPQWQIVLRNEFHDILPGSSIREVYETTNAELNGVVEFLRARIGKELETLARRIVPEGDRPALLVVNPDLSPRPLRVESKWELPGSQRVEDGTVLSGSQSVLGLGAHVLTSVSPPGPLQVSEGNLENAFVRVTLAEDGSLASVYDKRANREALAGRGNQLWAYVDKPRNWDAWDIQADYTSDGEEITSLESLRVLESGPHLAAIRVERRFRNSLIRQDLRLWANSARLDCRTTLDWHDRHYLLRARFPLDVRSGQASFETAFGVIQRPTQRNTSWEAARFEVVGHRFADLSEPGYGVALLNDGKYGYSALENELGLSLLRAPTFPDPLADEGVQTFTYALYPHEGGWLEGGVLMEAEDLNRPLLTHSCRTQSEAVWQALRVDGPQLGLGTLKILEDGGGLVLRTYEPAGCHGRSRVDLPQGWRIESEVNLLEQRTGEPNLSFGPFQIHSWELRHDRF